MEILTGHPFYGQRVGVLVFSTVTPRIPGDAGHAASFGYPVRYRVVRGGFAELIEGSPEIKENLLEACMELKGEGIRAILGDCGMMSLYQDCLGTEAGLPFVGSSLCQIPTVWQMIGREGSIGVLTGHSELLGERHLRSSGWTPEISLSVQGLQDEPHFREIVIEGGLALDVDEMRRNLLHAAVALRDKTPNLRGVVVECSNLATYSRDLYEFLKIPIFDTISAANLLQYAVNPPHYI